MIIIIKIIIIIIVSAWLTNGPDCHVLLGLTAIVIQLCTVYRYKLWTLSKRIMKKTLSELFKFFNHTRIYLPIIKWFWFAPISGSNLKIKCFLSLWPNARCAQFNILTLCGCQNQTWGYWTSLTLTILDTGQSWRSVATPWPRLTL